MAKIGAVFPTRNIIEPKDIQAYVQDLSGMGFHHLTMYDHVLGGDPAYDSSRAGSFTHKDPVHEALVLLGYIAAICELEIATGVLVLPQRQTVLVAKQAAELDILSNGRLRLGVGMGWNRIEYESLGRPFDKRGQIFEEQISLLRRLWREESVDHSGTFDKVPGAGLAPRPNQRPIPIWIGAGSPRALRRAGRLADGWIALSPPATGEGELAILREAAAQAGRDPATIGVDVHISVADGDQSRIRDEYQAWTEMGATHISLNSMVSRSFRYPDGSSPQEITDVKDHLRCIERAKAALGL